jgi:hypothetical protein
VPTASQVQRPQTAQGTLLDPAEICTKGIVDQKEVRKPRCRCSVHRAPVAAERSPEISSPAAAQIADVTNEDVAAILGGVSAVA